MFLARPQSKGDAVDVQEKMSSRKNISEEEGENCVNLNEQGDVSTIAHHEFSSPVGCLEEQQGGNYCTSQPVLYIPFLDQWSQKDALLMKVQ